MEAGKSIQTIPKEDERVLNSFRIINPDGENLVPLVKNLANFNQELTSLKDISNFLNEDNIYSAKFKLQR